MATHVRLYDSIFMGQAALHASGDRKDFAPLNVVWERLGGFDGPVWFTDSNLRDAEHMWNGKPKVAWLLEPRELHPENYAMAANYVCDFDALVSHDHDLLRAYREARPDGIDVAAPSGGTRLHSSDWHVHQKRSPVLVSMVASPKRSLPGHELRHRIASKELPNVKTFGADYGGAIRKRDAVVDYPFSIAIENVKKHTWFTEALLDCFLTGTVPIYWGADNLLFWGFDTRGVIAARDEHDIVRAADTVSLDLYIDMLTSGAIYRNLVNALRFTCAEDYLFSVRPELFGVER